MGAWARSMKLNRIDRIACDVFDAARESVSKDNAIDAMFVCKSLLEIETEYHLAPRPFRDFEEVTATKPGTCFACNKPWKIGAKLWWRPGARVARHYWCPKD